MSVQYKNCRAAFILHTTQVRRKAFRNDLVIFFSAYYAARQQIPWLVYNLTSWVKAVAVKAETANTMACAHLTSWVKTAGNKAPTYRPPSRDEHCLKENCDDGRLDFWVILHMLVQVGQQQLDDYVPVLTLKQRSATSETDNNGKLY